MRQLILTFAILPCLAADGPVFDMAKSPHVKLRPVPVSAVLLGPGFWADREKINVERSLPSMLKLLEEHGIIGNFLRLQGKSTATRKGPVYTDSDIYKWMEAAAFVLQTQDVPWIRTKLNELNGIIVGAQEPSGYLNTYYVEDKAKLRFTEMQRSHELYNLGHMLQAAIARYRADGDRKLLDAGIRYVDYLIKDFGPDKHPLLTGHPELEMALVELYRTTGERKYLDLAKYLLSGVERERLKLTDAQVKYMFSGVPFTSRTQFEGHAVRAMYASCGAADYYAETGDPAYLKTLDTLWNDLVNYKMYVTGGVGARSAGEAFGEKYELPNYQAYGESCAAIGNFMFNARMLAIHGQTKYADVMERALYNGINSGMSLDGSLYCYRNPLASTGEKIRNAWYDTTCCPPNLQRTFASLPGYLFSYDANTIYANLFHSAKLDWTLPDSGRVVIREETEYPWSGTLKFIVDDATAGKEFGIAVRIPDWAKGATVSVNGGAQQRATSGDYFRISRPWKKNDTLTVQLPLDVQPVFGNPRMYETVGKVAIQRGPIIYCMEQVDNNGANISMFDRLVQVNPVRMQGYTAEVQDGALGHVVVLKHEGKGFLKPAEDEPLYQYGGLKERKAVKAPVTLIPYYAWANRGEDAMEVWLPFQLN